MLGVLRVSVIVSLIMLLLVKRMVVVFVGSCSMLFRLVWMCVWKLV